jgi:AraC-like DNA-binding protein
MRLFARDHTFAFRSATTNRSAREVTYDNASIEVSLILEGNLTFFVDGRKRVIEGPCTTFQAYRRSLDVVTPAGRQVRTMWCNLSASELSETEWQWVGQLPPIQPIPALLPSLFSAGLALPNIDAGVEEEIELNQQTRDALGATIFSEYIRNAKCTPVTRPVAPAVAKAKQVLDNDYLEPWSVEALASIAGTNANYLIHLFKRHVGVSPIRYLWNRRVDAGIHLLETTSLSIEEISCRCGFQSAAHFSRRVKERRQVPPSLVRRGQS